MFLKQIERFWKNEEEYEHLPPEAVSEHVSVYSLGLYQIIPSPIQNEKNYSMPSVYI